MGKQVIKLDENVLRNVVYSAIKNILMENNTSVQDQWENEIRWFMEGLMNGEAFECGDKSIAVQIFKGSSNDNDPRYVTFKYGDRNLCDNHFYMQHSRQLSDGELKDIRDYMAKNGMVDRDEFNMEYGIDIDYSLYESTADAHVNGTPHTDYSHFAVKKDTGLIVNGWDYNGYDGSDLRANKKYYFIDDLIDNEFDPKEFVILTRKSCERRGINPDDMQNCWSNRGDLPLCKEKTNGK